MHHIFRYFCASMNSFASISFIFIFLVKGMFPGIDLGCELQKLPNLLDHYQEHKTCNDNSFLIFLVNDYINLAGDAEQPHHDDTDHEELPFHGNHQCCHASTFYASDGHFSITAFEYAFQAEFDSYKPPHSSEFLDSPLRPPQV